MQVFGRQRELKEIFSTQEYEMIGSRGFAEKSRTAKAKKENYGDKIKPEEIESKMFADLRLQHE